MNYKKDFPIFKNLPQLVYLDSAATSQKPQIVIDAITHFYSTYNSNIHRGLYPIAEQASAKVEEVRSNIQHFINANDNSEIIFTKGTTESINLVMQTWGDKNILRGDSIVSTVMDHHANFVPWQQLAEQKKAHFSVVDITPDGQLDMKDLLEKAKGAKIVVLPAMSNMLGTINPIKDIVKAIRNSNPQVVVLVDGAQIVSYQRVDMTELDCDFFVFSGHKMFGETGIGVLYGKKKHLDAMPPFLFGGDMIREVSIERTTFADSPGRFEGGTPHISGIVSLGAALEYIQTVGMEQIQEHENNLTSLLLEKLRKLEAVTIYGPGQDTLRGNLVSFTIDGIHAHDIAQVLADNSICVRAGHHCTMPLHKRLGIAASVRASVSIYTTEEDIEKMLRVIKKTQKLFT